MNLCKDCKHFRKITETYCVATAISLIDGESRHSVDHCAKARGRNGRCGLEGRLFEAAETAEAVPEAQTRGRKPRAPKVAPEETVNVQAE